MGSVFFILEKCRTNDSKFLIFVFRYAFSTIKTSRVLCSACFFIIFVTEIRGVQPQADDARVRLRIYANAHNKEYDNYCVFEGQDFSNNYYVDSRSFNKTAIISSCTVFGDFKRIRGLLTAITRPYSLNRK